MEPFIAFFIGAVMAALMLKVARGWMVIALFVALFLGVAGCASAPLTVDEEYAREDRITQDREVWSLCERVHAASGNPTWHIGHTHGKKSKSRSRRISEMRDDIFTNGCRRIYKKVEGEM